MRNQSESEPSQPESLSGYSKIRFILCMAGLCFGLYYTEKFLNPPNDPPFADVPIIPITEIVPSTVTEAKKESSLDKYYPQLEKYDQMSVQEFESLPRSERLAFSSWLIDKAEKDGSYDEHYGYGADGHAYFTRLSPENDQTPDWVIVHSYLHKRQLLMLETAPTTDAQPILDKTASKKMLSLVFYTTDNYKSDIYNDISADIDQLTNPGIIATAFKALGESTLMEGAQTVNGQTEHIKYRDVSFFGENAHTYYARFNLVEYSDYTGKPKSTWLLGSISDKRTKEGNK